VYCRALLRPVGCPHPGLILFAGLLRTGVVEIEVEQHAGRPERGP